MIDITPKSRVIMHMITSTACRPNASTRSEPVECSSACKDKELGACTCEAAGYECQRSRDLALFPGTTFYVQHLGPKPARLRTGNKSPGSDPVAMFLGCSSYFIVVLRCYSPVKDSIKCYST